MRILVVEDERKVASFIRQGLAEEGHTVEVAADGATALDLIEAGPPYDLIVLDLMLPRVDGFEILKRARGQRVSTPVLVLTARDSVADKVRGLDLGADDYLTKPFSFDEFLARVRALLRRGAAAAPVLSVADLTLDPSTREVRRGRRRITLTVREHALLEYFMRNAGRVLTRPMLAEHVWGLDFDSESNIVDVYVGYLRRKIDGPQERKLF
ncbi:MAG TPA: response regulator transcription factor, partial [Methylomirabilota bacterium]|nr:response regulator transcription factor [Methylomirabilota bacterium]